MTAMNMSVTLHNQWEVSSMILYFSFGTLGLVIGLGNLVIVCAIAKHKALRKSKAHLLIMALAVADAVNMTAYFFGGYYWVFTLFEGTANTMVTPWQCMTKIHNIIWVFSQSQSTLMLAVVSIDRFISVITPLRYLTLGTWYAWSMIIGVFASTWLIGQFGIALVYLSEDSVNNNTIALCFTPNVFQNSRNKLYGQYWSTAPITFALTSVVLYIFVWIVYKRGSSYATGRATRSETEQLRKERKLSITLGICCLSTIIFYILPYLAAVIAASLGFRRITAFFGLISMVNPGVNVFIYPLRLREMKQAIKSLVMWKKMPSDKNLWSNSRDNESRKCSRVSDRRNYTQTLRRYSSQNSERHRGSQTFAMLNGSQSHLPVLSSKSDLATATENLLYCPNNVLRSNSCKSRIVNEYCETTV